jgi:hypothetical protein
MTILERVAEAIDRRDYECAERLLQELKQQDPDNVWSWFYAARLQEISGDSVAAERGYREILCNVTNAKLISQARQGIERLVQIEQKQQQQARDRAMAEPDSKEPAILILKPIAPELRQSAAQKLAKIAHIDAYNARLLLPTRSMRLYRAGSMGSMRYYTDAIAAAEIPCFCLPINQINQIDVYKVRHFQSISPKMTIACQQSKDCLETLDFDWSQVSQRVEGLLPLFEQCVDRDVRGKVIRKTQVQDYARVCDLHLRSHNAIVRLCDRTYQFQEGVAFADTQRSAEQTTISENWNHLMNFLRDRLGNTPLWSDFNLFASMAMDFPDTLKLIEPQIDLFRREESQWDNVFQLYSGLVLLV